MAPALMSLISSAAQGTAALPVFAVGCVAGLLLLVVVVAMCLGFGRSTKSGQERSTDDRRRGSPSTGPLSGAGQVVLNPPSWTGVPHSGSAPELNKTSSLVTLSGSRQFGHGISVASSSDGNGGIVVSDVDKNGSAFESRSIAKGKRIVSLTVLFDKDTDLNDVRGILDHAGPYQIKLELDDGVTSPLSSNHGISKSTPNMPSPSHENHATGSRQSIILTREDAINSIVLQTLPEAELDLVDGKFPSEIDLQLSEDPDFLRLASYQALGKAKLEIDDEIQSQTMQHVELLNSRAISDNAEESSVAETESIRENKRIEKGAESKERSQENGLSTISKPAGAEESVVVFSAHKPSPCDELPEKPKGKPKVSFESDVKGYNSSVAYVSANKHGGDESVGVEVRHDKKTLSNESRSTVKSALKMPQGIDDAKMSTNAIGDDRVEVLKPTGVNNGNKNDGNTVAEESLCEQVKMTPQHADPSHSTSGSLDEYASSSDVIRFQSNQATADTAQRVETDHHRVEPQVNAEKGDSFLKRDVDKHVSNTQACIIEQAQTKPSDAEQSVTDNNAQQSSPAADFSKQATSKEKEINSEVSGDESNIKDLPNGTALPSVMAASESPVIELKPRKRQAPKPSDGIRGRVEESIDVERSTGNTKETLLGMTPPELAAATQEPFAAESTVQVPSDEMKPNESKPNGTALTSVMAASKSPVIELKPKKRQAPKPSDGIRGPVEEPIDVKRSTGNKKGTLLEMAPPELAAATQEPFAAESTVQGSSNEMEPNESKLSGITLLVERPTEVKSKEEIKDGTASVSVISESSVVQRPGNDHFRVKEENDNVKSFVNKRTQKTEVSKHVDVVSEPLHEQARKENEETTLTLAQTESEEIEQRVAEKQDTALLSALSVSADIETQNKEQAVVASKAEDVKSPLDEKVKSAEASEFVRGFGVFVDGLFATKPSRDIMEDSKAVSTPIDSTASTQTHTEKSVAVDTTNTIKTQVVEEQKTFSGISSFTRDVFEFKPNNDGKQISSSTPSDSARIEPQGDEQVVVEEKIESVKSSADKNDESSKLSLQLSNFELVVGTPNKDNQKDTSLVLHQSESVATEQHDKGQVFTAEKSENSRPAVNEKAENFTFSGSGRFGDRVFGATSAEVKPQDVVLSSQPEAAVSAKHHVERVDVAENSDSSRIFVNETSKTSKASWFEDLVDDIFDSKQKRDRKNETVSVLPATEAGVIEEPDKKKDSIAEKTESVKSSVEGTSKTTMFSDFGKLLTGFSNEKPKNETALESTLSVSANTETQNKEPVVVSSIAEDAKSQRDEKVKSAEASGFGNFVDGLFAAKPSRNKQDDSITLSTPVDSTAVTERSVAVDTTNIVKKSVDEEQKTTNISDIKSFTRGVFDFKPSKDDKQTFISITSDSALVEPQSKEQVVAQKTENVKSSVDKKEEKTENSKSAVNEKAENVTFSGFGRFADKVFGATSAEVKPQDVVLSSQPEAAVSAKHHVERVDGAETSDGSMIYVNEKSKTSKASWFEELVDEMFDSKPKRDQKKETVSVLSAAEAGVIEELDKKLDSVAEKTESVKSSVEGTSKTTMFSDFGRLLTGFSKEKPKSEKKQDTALESAPSVSAMIDTQSKDQAVVISIAEDVKSQRDEKVKSAEASGFVGYVDGVFDAKPSRDKQEDSITLSKPTDSTAVTERSVAIDTTSIVKTPVDEEHKTTNISDITSFTRGVFDFKPSKDDKQTFISITSDSALVEPQSKEQVVAQKTESAKWSVDKKEVTTENSKSAVNGKDGNVKISGFGRFADVFGATSAEVKPQDVVLSSQPEAAVSAKHHVERVDVTENSDSSMIYVNEKINTSKASWFEEIVDEMLDSKPKRDQKETAPELPAAEAGAIEEPNKKQESAAEKTESVKSSVEETSETTMVSDFGRLLTSLSYIKPRNDFKQEIASESAPSVSAMIDTQTKEQAVVSLRAEDAKSSLDEKVKTAEASGFVGYVDGLFAAKPRRDKLEDSKTLSAPTDSATITQTNTEHSVAVATTNTVETPVDEEQKTTKLSSISSFTREVFDFKSSKDDKKTFLSIPFDSAVVEPQGEDNVVAQKTESVKSSVDDKKEETSMSPSKLHVYEMVLGKPEKDKSKETALVLEKSESVATQQHDKKQVIAAEKTDFTKSAVNEKVETLRFFGFGESSGRVLEAIKTEDKQIDKLSASEQAEGLAIEHQGGDHDGVVTEETGCGNLSVDEKENTKKLANVAETNTTLSALRGFLDEPSKDREKEPVPISATFESDNITQRYGEQAVAKESIEYLKSAAVKEQNKSKFSGITGFVEGFFDGKPSKDKKKKTAFVSAQSGSSVIEQQGNELVFVAETIGNDKTPDEGIEKAAKVSDLGGFVAGLSNYEPIKDKKRKMALPLAQPESDDNWDIEPIVVVRAEHVKSAVDEKIKPTKSGFGHLVSGVFHTKTNKDKNQETASALAHTGSVAIDQREKDNAKDVATEKIENLKPSVEEKGKNTKSSDFGERVAGFQIDKPSKEVQQNTPIESAHSDSALTETQNKEGQAVFASMADDVRSPVDEKAKTTKGSGFGGFVTGMFTAKSNKDKQKETKTELSSESTGFKQIIEEHLVSAETTNKVKLSFDEERNTVKQSGITSFMGVFDSKSNKDEKASLSIPSDSVVLEQHGEEDVVEKTSKNLSSSVYVEEKAKNFSELGGYSEGLLIPKPVQETQMEKRMAAESTEQIKLAFVGERSELEHSVAEGVGRAYVGKQSNETKKETTLQSAQPESALLEPNDNVENVFAQKTEIVGSSVNAREIKAKSSDVGGFAEGFVSSKLSTYKQKESAIASDYSEPAVNEHHGAVKFAATEKTDDGSSSADEKVKLSKVSGLIGLVDILSKNTQKETMLESSKSETQAVTQRHEEPAVAAASTEKVKSSAGKERNKSKFSGIPKRVGNFFDAKKSKDKKKETSLVSELSESVVIIHQQNEQFDVLDETENVKSSLEKKPTKLSDDEGYAAGLSNDKTNKKNDLASVSVQSDSAAFENYDKGKENVVSAKKTENGESSVYEKVKIATTSDLGMLVGGIFDAKQSKDVPKENIVVPGDTQSVEQQKAKDFTLESPIDTSSKVTEAVTSTVDGKKSTGKLHWFTSRGSKKTDKVGDSSHVTEISEPNSPPNNALILDAGQSVGGDRQSSHVITVTNGVDVTHQLDIRTGNDGHLSFNDVNAKTIHSPENVGRSTNSALDLPASPKDWLDETSNKERAPGTEGDHSVVALSSVVPPSMKSVDAADVKTQKKGFGIKNMFKSRSIKKSQNGGNHNETETFTEEAQPVDVKVETDALVGALIAQNIATKSPIEVPNNMDSDLHKMLIYGATGSISGTAIQLGSPNEVHPVKAIHNRVDTESDAIAKMLVSNESEKQIFDISKKAMTVPGASFVTIANVHEHKGNGDEFNHDVSSGGMDTNANSTFQTSGLQTTTKVGIRDQIASNDTRSHSKTISSAAPVFSGRGDHSNDIVTNDEGQRTRSNTFEHLERAAAAVDLSTTELLSHNEPSVIGLLRSISPLPPLENPLTSDELMKSTTITKSDNVESGPERSEAPLSNQSKIDGAGDMNNNAASLT